MRAVCMYHEQIKSVLKNSDKISLNRPYVKRITKIDAAKDVY